MKALSARTRIPVAVFLREAIEDVLVKYGVKVPKARAVKGGKR